MELKTENNMFTLFDDTVTFVFKCDIIPIKKGNLIKITMKGTIPVPETEVGDRIILPIDEGVVIDADGEYESADFNLDKFHSQFCGRDATLSMIIIERNKKYLLIALTDGTYSGYEVLKENNIYKVSINAKRETTVVYGIFDTLIEACKKYREIKNMKRITLNDKINDNPDIKKLKDGAIFWVWSDKAAEVMYSETNTDILPGIGDKILLVAEELHTMGIENAMFGFLFEADSYLSEVLYKKYGYMSTQYDNYNDVLNPALLQLIPNNRAKNCDYTKRRMKDYPDGIRISEDGNMVDAWAIKGFDGEYYAQKSLCPVVAAKRMKEEVPEILKEYPYYKGRFIDVFGCSLADCFSDGHPVTRTECVKVKDDAYGSLKNMGLIVGTEDGFEEIMNNLVYSEGIHTPVCFRYKDSGRKYMYMHNDEDSKFLEKQMLNPKYRIPLWQMVNHECIMTFPYWGISTAASKRVLTKKILFACLFGCPPLYSFTVGDFDKVKEDILKSYNIITDVCKKVVTLPMTEYKVLTDDYMIQKTVFGDKYEVVANFSEKEYLYNNQIIKPLDFIFEERQ